MCGYDEFSTFGTDGLPPQKVKRQEKRGLVTREMFIRFPAKYIPSGGVTALADELGVSKGLVSMVAKEYRFRTGIKGKRMRVRAYREGEPRPESMPPYQPTHPRSRAILSELRDRASEGVLPEGALSELARAHGVTPERVRQIALQANIVTARTLARVSRGDID